jgi:hypothetical protein
MPYTKRGLTVCVAFFQLTGGFMNSLSRVRNGSALMLALSALWSAGVCAADDASAFDHVQQIQAGDLNIGYVDIGPRDGQPVILLHGWPYDIHSYAAVAPALAKQGFRVIVPYLRGYGTTRFLCKYAAQRTALGHGGRYSSPDGRLADKTGRCGRVAYGRYHGGAVAGAG